MPRKSSLLSGRTCDHYAHWSSVESFVTGVSHLRPVAVVLFGSVARGNFTQHSDADVLVIFDRPMDWIEVYNHSDGWVQPIVKTKHEILQGLAEPIPFYHEMVEDGVVLWEQDGAMTEFRRMAREIQQRYRMVRSGARWEWQTGKKGG